MFFICSKRGDTANVWAWIEWVCYMRCIYAAWRINLHIEGGPVCCACFFVWRQSVLLYLFTHVDKESIVSQQIKRNRWLLLKLSTWSCALILRGGPWMLCVEMWSHITWSCEFCAWRPVTVCIYLALETDIYYVRIPCVEELRGVLIQGAAWRAVTSVMRGAVPFKRPA